MFVQTLTHFQLPFNIFLSKPIIMAAKVNRMVSSKRDGMWSYALKLYLRSALMDLLFPELPVLQIRGFVSGGAQRRDKGCHCCYCCCWRTYTSSAWKLIKTRISRTLPTKQWVVTINKLQDVGSQLSVTLCWPIFTAWDIVDPTQVYCKKKNTYKKKLVFFLNSYG